MMECRGKLEVASHEAGRSHNDDLLLVGWFAIVMNGRIEGWRRVGWNNEVEV